MEDVITLNHNLKLSLMLPGLKYLCSFFQKCCTAPSLFPFSFLLRPNFLHFLIHNYSSSFDVLCSSRCCVKSIKMAYQYVFYAFIFFLNKYLLGTYYMPTTELGPGIQRGVKEIQFLASWNSAVSSLDKRDSGSSSYENNSF